MQIRRPTNADQQQIEHLRQERESLLKQVNSSFVGSSMNLTQIFTDPNAHVWVAEKHDCLIGYVISWYHNSPYGKLDADTLIIDEIVLDLHHHHQHVAEQLLDTAIKYFGNIQTIFIRVPKFFAVEQAFWRAKQAISVDSDIRLTRSHAHEWMKL